jgi:streptogramin lyase
MVSVAALIASLALALILPLSASAASRTYTLDADFDEGVLFNVNHDDVSDQLQLDAELTTYPIMWIANAGEDSVSKWDTENNVELARYHTWFGSLGTHGSWEGPAPSRTCVDSEGNCYVANRHFDNRPADVIKILATDWIDRNGNGLLDTSYDADSSGAIEPSEMLPMTDSNSNGVIDDAEIMDERIAWAVSVGPANGLGRSLAIDPNGNIWLGLYNSQAYYKLSGADGSILAGPIDVSPNTPYGALVDKDGILWGASLGSTLLELDTNIDSVNAVHNHSSYGSDYGIAIGYDSAGNTRVYQAEYSGSTYIEYDSGNGTFSNPAASLFACLGIAVDSNGDIYASDYYGGSLTKFAPDGSVIYYSVPQVAGEARGTVVDSDDNVWVVHRANHQMAKFNGSDGAHLGAFDTGRYPYTYSDATGLGFRGSLNPQGSWTVDCDSGVVSMPWGTISWNSSEPDGTQVTVRVRSSNDGVSWSGWEDVTNGAALTVTPDGRYLQVEATLESTSDSATPVLYDLTVEDAGALSGSISGMKFLDYDHDGQLDPTFEPGIAGWEIQLMDSSGNVVATTTTDANGDYAFTGLQSGTYTVAEVQALGWIPTVPASGAHTVVVAGGQSVTDVDFGNRQEGVPPIPELPTYALFGIGLLGIVGFLGFQSLRHRTTA